jgi:D-cysteine desulfhydrase
VECHLVLGGTEPQHVNGNLLLDTLFGAHIHWAGDNRKGEDIPEITAHLQKAGKIPCVVPYGGSNETGALGFVAAAMELVEQRKGPDFSHIIFASSSGGTQAGLMVGKQILGMDWRLVGIKIDKEEASEKPFNETVLSLANATAQRLDVDYTFTPENLILNSDYLGDGYGVVGSAEKEAISIMARIEGILLDPVYTGRAMAGLIGMIRSGELGKDDRVLFWHTGGSPALFAYPKALF